MPLTGGFSVPTQTVRTSNSSLSSRAFVRVRQFESVYRHVIIGACAKKDTSMPMHQLVPKSSIVTDYSMRILRRLRFTPNALQSLFKEFMVSLSIFLNETMTSEI
jgi:hypothetical protein